MKKSEISSLHKPDDLEALKAMVIELDVRDARMERFEDVWLSKFKNAYGDKFYWDQKKFCYTLEWNDDLNNKKRAIDFYPKANKLLIRHENMWVKPGLRWLIENFIEKTPHNFL